jgi:CHAD domain-containing protein
MASEARRLEKKPPSAKEESIHTIRLLIKRLRALLWLIRPALTKSIHQQAQIDLRHAAGVLSARRDRAVMQTILRGLKPKKVSHRKQVEALAEGLRTCEGVAASASSGDDVLRHAVGLFLKTVVEVQSGMRTSTDWPDPEKRLTEASLAMKRAGKRALRDGGDTCFHDWRKKVKRLLYLLEFMPFAVGMHTKRRLKRVGQLQHVLGEYHDCAVTQVRLRKESVRTVRWAVQLLNKKKKQLRKKAKKLDRAIPVLAKRQPVRVLPLQLRIGTNRARGPRLGAAQRHPT